MEVRRDEEYDSCRKPSWYSMLASQIVKHSSLLKLIGFPLYYLVGVLYYTKNEGWTVLQTTYFITVTITTCGYGFFHPTSDASKVFTIFYIFFGLIIIITVVNDLACCVLSGAQESVIRFTHRSIGSCLGMRDGQMSDAAMRFYKVQYSLIAIFSMGLIGALFFSSNEDWTYIDAVYWTVCTMTTVGYGDLTIKYESSRVFAIFFIFGCVLIYATAAANLIEVYMETLNTAAAIIIDAEDLNKDEGKFSDEWVEKILPLGGEKEDSAMLSKSKVILLALIELGIVDQKRDIKPLADVSDNLLFLSMSIHLSLCILLYLSLPMVPIPIPNPIPIPLFLGSEFCPS